MPDEHVIHVPHSSPACGMRSDLDFAVSTGQLLLPTSTVTAVGSVPIDVPLIVMTVPPAVGAWLGEME